MAKKDEGNKPSTISVKILVSIGGEVNYQCGEIVELEAEMANNLIEAGYAEKA